MKTKKMKIEIKYGHTQSVIFSHEFDNNSIKITLEAAIKAGANLRGADLGCANLGCADLGCANLRGANLGCANLRGANLRGADLGCADLGCADLGCADLRGANLRGADLRGADLRGADLRGADLGDCGKLTGDRPYFEIGPIGSRSDKICSFLTDKGIFIQAGCFFGSIEEFEQKVIKTHGDNIHAKEYFSAIALIQFHFNWWNNKE